MTALETKIKELKQRAGYTNYNTVSVNEFGELQERVSLLDQRQVEGYGVIWNKPNSYREKFIKGAFAKSINERGPGKGGNYEIKFLYQHNQSEPLALFEELKEDDIGLYFRTKPLDDIGGYADRALKQIRSGTLNNFSIGFDFDFDKIEYDESDDTLIMKEAPLFEISLVSIPADMNTYAIRSRKDIEELHDETEDFIKSLPRKNQLEARQLFTRHKSLIDVEPLEQRKIALDKDEPVAVGLDYSYLLNNLKLF